MFHAMSNNMVEGRTRCMWSALCWILLQMGLSGALDVHIADSQAVGNVVFDASIAPSEGWTYVINPLTSSYTGLQVLAVGCHTGHVVLNQAVACQKLPHNPFHVYLEAWPHDLGSEDITGPHNRTVVPLTVHVHGQNCFSKHRRKSRTSHLTHLGHRDSVRISALTGLTLGACFDTDTPIMSIAKAIPSSLVDSRQCEFSLHGLHSGHFLIEESTGDINTKTPFCIDKSQTHLQGSMKCFESGKQKPVIKFPISILLQSQDKLWQRRLNIEQSQNTRPHSRVRRAAKKRFDPPVFPQSLYVRNVAEEQGKGLVVDVFPIEGSDSRDVTYSLSATRDGRSQSMFSIDPTSGEVRTTQSLDREGIAVHYFQLVAEDVENSRLVGYSALTIYVDDINDHDPEFESPLYVKEESENIGIGSTILTVRATDKDAGPNSEIEYSILNPSPVNDAFSMDSRTGSVVTRQRLDREKVKFYRLEIQASDKGPVPNRRTATSVVEITVLDENDNYPQFTKSSYMVNVSEDIDPSGNPVIAEIKATDTDEGSNAMVRYSIIGGNSMGTFNIDAMSGRLSVMMPLDYERVQSYRLGIRAQDGGRPPKSNSTTVLVRVLDVNDNDPRFLTTLFQESVLENVPVDYLIMRVQAYDADYGANSALQYTIMDAPSSMPIIIDQTTGELTTSRRLDRETHARFSFKVLAKDQGKPPRSATATIEVNVRDINDNAPIFDPRVYYEVVSEEAYPGTPVVTVTAKDADENENGRVNYAVSSGNERAAFNIISQMGQGLITVARSLNYKEQSRYILTVTATDPGGLVDTATVFINISDANTFRPTFQGTPYKLRVFEDKSVGMVIFQVSATDQDSGENARVSYNLADNDAFSINPSNGEISVKEPLDREKTAGYAISVTATDHGRPAKSDTTDVEIEIGDVNDNAPKFMQEIYNGMVMEDAVSGKSILTISATDADVGRNGMIRYTFEGGNNGKGDFMLDPTLGVLRIAEGSSLDRERVQNYELKAFAVDRGQPMLSTSVIIKVEVKDVNDNAPQFAASNIRLEIFENSPIGSTVGQISAIDPDEGANAEVQYNIIGGPDADSFALSTRSNEPAILTTLIELDYETGKTQYTVFVQARSFHLQSDATIIIQVIDVNDNMPLMEDFIIIFNNFENYFPTGPIGRVPARDPDVRDELHYKFVTGNQANILHLNEVTGDIRLDYRLNSDVPTNGTLQVSVSDGINEVKATCQLFVRMVTEDMLDNSITVKLEDISYKAFLSPLYHRFVSALASMIPTSEDNIFIINVRNDPDTHTKVLDVSFSVRERVWNNRDVFYPQQFLQERVYLQRTLLTKLSTLTVLPFDDNLCVREPCLNFEECVSVLKFDNASSFISSDAMLFRPIYPRNSVRCRCPKGFTGMRAEYMCDTEVNLCYSSPCGGNGTCVQHEGGYTCLCKPGFTGANCEIDMMNTKYDTCPPNICKSPSTCSPLIRGGFRCEKCPDNDNSGKFCEDCASKEHHTSFCELRTRSFTRGAFLLFPSLKRRHRFNIRLMFATKENGLLFYNGRYNEMHDFIALEVVNDQVQFSFSLGSDVTMVRATLNGGVSDGEWHLVVVEYFNRTVTLTIDEECDTEVAIQYGKQIGNYSCGARVTKVLEERCATITEICHRFLDLTGPFQIGGVPSLPVEFQVQHTDFIGCIRDVYIDENFLDLNDYVWNNGSREGCAPKRNFCSSKPCKEGGVCKEAWGTYQCSCPVGFGGRDCSLKIEEPRRLKGSSYLLYRNNLDSIELPWYNGIAFRTHQKTALLMSIDLGRNTHVNINIINGLIHYIHPRKTLVVDDVLVNDGEWHYLETRWLRSNELVVTLDYGQIQKSATFGNWVNGKTIAQVLVGGQLEPSGASTLVHNGLDGCVKNIKVGKSQSVLTEPQEHNVEPGCRSVDLCSAGGACPENSDCQNLWTTHQCTCHAGYHGSQCDDVCIKWNPCKNGATCRRYKGSSDGYTCECLPLYLGRYCEQSIGGPCPNSWWGYPICGPCNCPVDKGFDPSCNKTSGECVCKENHYRPEGSDTCYPCDCYSIGSYKPECDAVTGQCDCKRGVVGRKCDSCSSRFAEVTRRGCEVVYDACPRSFKSQIWWDRTWFGIRAVQECPEKTVGDATRQCSENGWQEPDLFNCTSKQFDDFQLDRQLQLLESGTLKVNTFLAKDLVHKLDNATRSTEKLTGKDVHITYRLLKYILEYENKQSGLNLTHTQDRNFIQNLVTSVSRILSTDTSSHWAMIQRGSSGAVELMERMEEYTNTLATNMLQLFTQPFDAVHDNVVMGLDYVVKGNMSTIPIPKYNNKVRQENMFDQDTHVVVPAKVLREPSMAEFVAEMVDGSKARAVIGYVIYKTLGDILPHNFVSDVKMPEGKPVVVNAPVFTLNVVDGNKTVRGRVKEPVTLRFKQLEAHNRSNPQCVYWKFSNSDNGPKGHWSSDGCEVIDRIEEKGSKFVVCKCNHLSSFGVLMAVSPVEFPLMESLAMEIVTFTGLTVTMLCLLVVFMVLCCLRGLHSNSNSIHINLVFTIFIANLAFLIGINRTDPQIMCKVIAILLHYFYMCTFAWMFVESLHLYRMMTEIRNINYGSMKFYYVVGYVVPGIIVGLAVGLVTDGYGNPRFCWIKTTDLLIWSFAGPICLILVVNAIIFMMSLRASCRSKPGDEQFSQLKTSLKVAMVLLPLVGIAWVFGLLSVNDNMLAHHYLFAAFNLFQGIFILLAYILFNKRVRQELKFTVWRIQGKKGFDDALHDNTRSTILSRSALAYHHNNSSLEGGLNRMNVGISTTSTTSRSTSKSSGGMYRQEGYIPSSGTSTSGNMPSAPGHSYPANAGIPPYGYDSSMFHDKPLGDPDTGETSRRKHRRDSDSDSELSAMEHADMELASSHSSDDDDDDHFRWEPKPKNKALDRVRKQSRQQQPPPVPPGPVHSTPHPPPPPYVPRGHWPGEAYSTTTASETDLKSPNPIKISDTRRSTEKVLTPNSFKGSRDLLSPPERVDSLPQKHNLKSSQERVAVQVLTHNGSITSESESSASTTASSEKWA